MVHEAADLLRGSTCVPPQVTGSMQGSCNLTSLSASIVIVSFRSNVHAATSIAKPRSRYSSTLFGLIHQGIHSGLYYGQLQLDVRDGHAGVCVVFQWSQVTLLSVVWLKVSGIAVFFKAFWGSVHLHVCIRELLWKIEKMT